MMQKAPLMGSGGGGDTNKVFTVPALLPVLSATPGGTRWAGPELGQHTDWVLKAELGLSLDRIGELRKIGAIA